MIVSVIIAIGKRYQECAKIADFTFWKFHCCENRLIIITEPEPYLSQACKLVGIKNFYEFQYDKQGKHNRAFSSLKPIIMDLVVKDLQPEATHILSLDADTMFSGNILDEVKKEIKDNKDLYLVKRTDSRMLKVSSLSPGSGFTLWKRNSKFIELFIKHYQKKHAGIRGGSQDIIVSLSNKMNSRILKNPFLHFVSPDLQNPNITDEEISTFKPAYIHLHGENSYQRLQRFKKILL